MENIDTKKVLGERDRLMDSLYDPNGNGILSPYDKDYQTVIKTVANLDNSMRDAAKINLEAEKLEFERNKNAHEIENERRKIDLDTRKAEFDMELEKMKFDLDKSRFEFDKVKHAASVESEKDKNALERERLKSNEKTTKWSFWTTIIAGGISAAASVGGTIFKSVYGSKAISEGTRNTFLLDQDKVQSKAAANNLKDLINHFK